MRHLVATVVVVTLVLAAVIGLGQSSPGSAPPPSAAESVQTPTRPRDVDELSTPTRTDGGLGYLELRNDAYVAAYDEARRNPAWVCYTLTGAISHTGYRRENGFISDTRTAAHVRSEDYTRSGYDRGHMAPSFGIFAFAGSAAERQTYFCSNIVPQTHALNNGPWGDVEELEAKTWAPHSNKIRVFCGPAYREPVTTIGCGVAVPCATWKVVIRATKCGRFEALAFFMPQAVAQTDRPEKYLTSVRTIEESTHLDFFAALPDDEESALETSVATTLWR